MIDVRVFSITIIIIVLLVTIIGYGLLPLFRYKKQTNDDSKLMFGFLIAITILFSLAFVIILSTVKPESFVKDTKKDTPQPVQTILNSAIQTSTTQPSSTVSSNMPPGIIPPGPTFTTPTTQTPNFGGSTFFTSYYQFNPNDRSLKKLSLDNITGGTNISDYFHRNDESIFVLDDGTIISILGDDIQKYKSSPSMRKIRVSGNRYIGISNGKLYTSSDLKNWAEYSNLPRDIIDFDVPVNQNNIIYIRTPNENILFDSKTNQTISTESPDPKRFGSVLTSFVKYNPDGITHNRGADQMTYKGYIIGDVDNQDRLYIFPVKLNDNYTIKEIYTADSNVILKIDSFVKPADTISVTNDVITR